MQTESKQEILKRRKELEQELRDLLKETKSDFGLENIKNVIYNEEESEDFHRLISMFDRGGDTSELSNILELVSDAWNYFPHKILGGISPAEKLSEHREKNG